MPAISTTDLCKRLKITITPKDLGEICEGAQITQAAKPEGKKVGTFWLESDVPGIARAIAAHLELIALEEDERQGTPEDDDSF